MQLTLWARLLYLVPTMMWRNVVHKPLKPDALRRLQNKKLRTLIQHSYAHVPYYRNIFNKVGLEPEDIQTVDDLPKIPVTRKADLVDLPIDEVLASNIEVDRCQVSRTSGTTGIPLTVYWDKKAKLIERLVKVRYHLDCGDTITNKTVDLGAGTSLVPEGQWFQKIGIFRTKWVSPHIGVKKQIEEIKAYDPRALVSYPTLFEELCKEVIDEAVTGLDIRLVFTGGEHLDDFTRVLIKKALDAEVFVRYGAREVGRISNECVQHQGLHTCAESVVVEITREGETLPNGDEGEVTVTNLDNYVMPFIRYDVGDIGVLLGGECTCGKYSPLMRLTEGRTKERIPLSDGRMVPALVPIEVLRYVQGLRQFQLIQEARDRFLVRIIRGRGMSDTVPDAIKLQLKSILGNVEIDVREVDHIAREKSGKLRQFISHVTTA